MADGSEAFFHATDLQAMRFTDVEDGLTVVFDLVPDAVSGARATGVRLAPAARRRKP
jgi:cold shock CspA family protein